MPDGDMADAVGAERCVRSDHVIDCSAGLGRSWLVATRGDEKRRRDLGHIVFRAGEHDGSESTSNRRTDRVVGADRRRKNDNEPLGRAMGKTLPKQHGQPGCRGYDGWVRNRGIIAAWSGVADTVGFRVGPGGIGVGIGRGEFRRMQHLRKWAAASTDGEVYEELDNMLSDNAGAGTGDWYPSMGQDVQNERPSEIDFMNGHVLRKGVEVGVETPVTASIVDAMRRIDRGELVPNASNVEMILSNAGY